MSVRKFEWSKAKRLEADWKAALATLFYSFYKYRSGNLLPFYSRRDDCKIHRMDQERPLLTNLIISISKASASFVAF